MVVTIFGAVLRLTPHWEKERILLVRTNEALRLCRVGGCEDVPVHRAVGWVESLAGQGMADARRFVAQEGLCPFNVSDVSDTAVLRLLCNKVKTGELAVICEGESRAGAQKSPDADQARVVHEIDRAVRQGLSYGSRRYRLVADVQLEGLLGRDNYEVVPHSDAVAVLRALARQDGPTGALATLLTEAAELLTKDWRPPSSPNGLVLLQKIPARPPTASDDGPVLTPSQMKALLDSEKPVAFFARFVDDYGKPIEGFTGMLQHGDDELDMPFSGSAFAQVAGLKGQKSATLTVVDDDLGAFIDALKKRWKEIRGEVEDDPNAWRDKEEALAEVLLRKGALPELNLEAEKKHTFMVRPRVALCRLRGLYFETDRCFLLPAAVPSLKRLVQIAASYPESEVLIAGHTDTAGSEAHNLELSGQRAEVLKAYLCDDADAWLGYYDDSVAEAQRWGDDEDVMMLDAVVPDADLAGTNHVRAYQAWHNDKLPDARTPDLDRTLPKGWEALEEDGVLGPKTRRQLILDYMGLDGTSLPEGTRIVTYACGEFFPLTDEEGEVDTQASDGEHVAFDRRVEIFFFDKPFGILPPVPGVAQGESSTEPTSAPKGDKLYPEWCLRSYRRHAIEAEGGEFSLRLCDVAMEPYAERPFLVCMEGSPEIRGTTDTDGYLNIEAPRRGGTGYVEVWPDDDPEYKIRWEIDIGIHLPPVTPLGASSRLRNLGYYNGDLTSEMTDELREAVSSFQIDSDGLEANGDLDLTTAQALSQLHDDDEEEADSAASEGDAT